MKKLIAFSLVAILSSSTTFVFATETTPTENTSSEDVLDATFQDMIETLKSGGEVSFATSLEKTGGLTISSEPQFSLDNSSIDWNNLDASLTNLGFSAVSASLADSYDSIDLSGKAGGCTQLFESSFGDLTNDLTLEEPKIPSGFNANSMLKENQESINSTYKSAMQTQAYTITKDVLEVQNIFNQAAQGPTKEDGKTIDEMLTTMGISERDRNMLTNHNDQKINIKNNYKTELKVDDPSFSKEEILANAIDSYSSCRIAEIYAQAKQAEQSGYIDDAEDLIYDTINKQ